MSRELWTITTHNIPASHIRGFERGTRDEETSKLQLAVKQYTPKANLQSIRGDVTFIMAGGIDNSKETFEPLFDDLLQQFPGIRNIWAIDPATYGESFWLNRDTIGDEPSWLDIPRDILHTMNHLQDLMPPPIIGIGHSLGGALLTVLSTWHPRLFTGLILTEPAYGPKKGIKWPTPNKFYPSVLVAKRRVTWASRDEARKAFAKAPLYKSYDPRVVDKVVQHDLVDVSSLNDKSRRSLGKIEPGTSVTLATPKSITESIWVHPRPKLANFPANPGDDIPDEHVNPIPGFGRPEAPVTWNSIPHLYPPVLLAWGAESELFGEKRAANRKWTAGVMGTGHGGGGGLASGQVTEVSIAGAHHHIPFEKPTDLARAAASWSKKIREGWLQKMDERKSQPEIDHYKVNEEILSRYAKL
ncbi:hypothetical protein M409DRAFT_17922 [Zasmidium cellare ATCC 36951]|uniref:Serine aminopeptidase S33 domain-containing protein n=1 Tax=Zasmidium cellare ATCC 36951 TaxID=1080233 RepID=A0A6A6CXC1_ZASCE|nr:uncharacterized protein M409DRAFT_17922 [Zasmidium cellare ATCC 36951]KAF2171685.1 hypothetical protein M409DRAFT_17922 [Zasmidium cellare ATCC 36951]